MVWVKFTDNFDWWPKAHVTIAYKAGKVMNVTRRCADAAVEKGKAKRTANPRRVPASPESEVSNGD